MQVIIPLAGKGTRLRPHTHLVPKPLLKVAGRPVMDWVMDRLEGLDVSELIFITGHLKEQVEAYARKRYPIPSRFIEQKVQDGTAGAVNLGPENQLAPEHVHRLVLPIVVLEAQDVTGPDVEDLADVAVGPRPHQLVSPGLLHPVGHLGHQISAAVRVNDEGWEMQARTQTPQPTHPSCRTAGWPVSSMTRAAAPIGQRSAQTRQATPRYVTQRSG
jgi:hypothetical protein